MSYHSQGRSISGTAVARHTATRDGAMSADNVLARIMFSESSAVSTVSSYQARMQAFLDNIEPHLPTSNHAHQN